MTTDASITVTVLSLCKSYVLLCPKKELKEENTKKNEKKWYPPQDLLQGHGKSHILVHHYSYHCLLCFQLFVQQYLNIPQGKGDQQPIILQKKKHKKRSVYKFQLSFS